MKKFFRSLAKDFSDKEYAHAYMEGHAVSRIATQVHVLRKQRGWSQEELSQKSGIAQERISKIESADFNSLTMKTLQKLARAFDVHAQISFIPFKEAIEGVARLHSHQLEVAPRSENLEGAFDNQHLESRLTAMTFDFNKYIGNLKSSGGRLRSGPELEPMRMKKYHNSHASNLNDLELCDLA